LHLLTKEDLDVTTGSFNILTEDTPSGEYHIGRALVHLEQRLESLPDVHNDYWLLTALMTAYNQLGILWSSRSDKTKSETFLKKAEKVYAMFTRMKKIQRGEITPECKEDPEAFLLKHPSSVKPDEVE
jgi:hypothetical protein